MCDYRSATRALRSEAYTETLLSFLAAHPHGCARVLEASGPAAMTVELAKAGFDVAHVEAGEAAVASMQQRVQDAGVADKVRFITCEWHQLDKHVEEGEFDIVLCLGNVLTHATAAEGTFSAVDATETIEAAMEQFARAVKEGGMCVADKVPCEQAGEETVAASATVDGQAVVVDYKYTNNTWSGVRTWDYKVTVDGQTTEKKLESLLLTEDILQDKMVNAGFECPQLKEWPGDANNAVFYCSKAFYDDGEGGYAGTANLYIHMDEIYRKVWDPKGRMCWGFFPNKATNYHEAGAYHVERMGQKAGLNKDSKLLDIGCGNGNTCIELATKFGCEVVGLDLTQAYIDNAKKAAAQVPNINASWVCCTLEAAGFKDGEFTHVWSNGTLSHISRETRPAFYSECFRVLRPGGVLCMDDATMPCGPEKVSKKTMEDFYKRLHYETPIHTLKGNQDFLKDLGFETIEVEDLTEHQLHSYVIVRERANCMGYFKLAKQYQQSAAANEAGEIGWGLWIMRRP